MQRNILGETRRLFHEPCASVKRTTGKNWATNGREKERAEWQRHRRDGGRVQPTAEAAAAAATRGRAVRSKARKWNRLAVTLRQPSSVARPRAMAGAFCCPLASDSNSRGRTENWRARDGERERETADSPCILDSRACVVAVGFVRLRWNRRRRWQRARQRRESRARSPKETLCDQREGSRWCFRQEVSSRSRNGPLSENSTSPNHRYPALRNTSGCVLIASVSKTKGMKKGFITFQNQKVTRAN